MNLQMNKQYRKKGKTTKFFPILQHRFDTKNHPVLRNSNRDGKKVRFKLSHHEMMMLEGLSASLQTAHNEAIRIALYELAKKGCRGQLTPTGRHTIQDYSLPSEFTTHGLDTIFQAYRDQFWELK